MERSRNIYHQHVLTARKLILDARYYKEHRAEWEEDISAWCLSLAEENLKQAELLLQQEETIYERSERSTFGFEKKPHSRPAAGR
jgi:hypothetical protein